MSVGNFYGPYLLPVAGGNQFDGMFVNIVCGGAGLFELATGTLTQGLGSIEANVKGTANLLSSALGQRSPSCAVGEARSFTAVRCQRSCNCLEKDGHYGQCESCSDVPDIRRIAAREASANRSALCHSRGNIQGSPLFRCADTFLLSCRGKAPISAVSLS